MPERAPREDGNRRWILDTAAILNAAWDRDAAACSIPPAVHAELRPGGRDHARLAQLIAAGLEVTEPAAPDVLHVSAAARRLGESRLSVADLEVAALARSRRARGDDAVVVTDDYALQNLLTHLELPYQGARMQGISETRRYALRCSGCGRWYPPQGTPKEGGECPVCGARVNRRRARD